MADNTTTVFQKVPRCRATRPRARRYPFVASIELTDLHAETLFRGQTRDLSLFGCSVEMQKILPTGTTVRARIVHSGGHFIALGRVVYVRQSRGMGIAFTTVEPNHELMLEKWIAESRVTGA